ncbi:glycoside hydrolase family 16 protein [Mucor lusitanicus]|uniref:Glycoside hydrolase family 16 protein n=2 Tax=Mucor circinelloides f. lusitanicus TaxID=29924 RepID=A0A168KBY8_MUCCL|nr:glycoside hydrolase family 16 protein [Mucor lusitanicus CBS 277.49]
MYISNLSLCAVALFGAVASAATTLNQCTSGTTKFSEGLGDWTEERGLTNGWKITDQGLVMTLEAPKKIVRMTNSSDNNNPYNKYASPTSPNFIYSTLLHYGSVSFDLQAAGKAGAVTAAVLLAPGGDEIDFEMLGADHNKVQTNFFYGSNPIYGVNSADTEVNINTASGTHNYTVDWSPERIEFFVDGKLIRTVENKDDCDKNGDCTYPTHAAAVQIGLWDSSAVSSTTEWAKGPIDWTTGETISATVKSVTVNCNPKYNDVN